MGISIHLSVSKAVTKEEWAAVYAESLKLIEHFPLVDYQDTEIIGMHTKCLVKTAEHEEQNSLRKDEKMVGWWTMGDSESLRLAECFWMPKDIAKEYAKPFKSSQVSRYEPYEEDALYGNIPRLLKSCRNDTDHFDTAYHLWNHKTQAEPYHMYLLAIGCLVTDRLGRKAYITGDTTKEQCIDAVKLANKYLDRPIHIPNTCIPDELFQRVDSFPIPEEEKLRLCIKAYLGERDEAIGKALREQFSTGLFDACWEEEIQSYIPSQAGDEEVVHVCIDDEARYDISLLIAQSYSFDHMQNSVEVLNYLPNRRMKRVRENRGTYEIINTEELMYYEDGDTFHPDFKKALNTFFGFYHGMTKETYYQELMTKDPRERCAFLLEQQKTFRILDTDLEKIFRDICENERSFERYYPMVRVVINDQNHRFLVTAIVLNDALYNKCMEWLEESEEGQKGGLL